MIRWREAYERQKESREFANYFGRQGQVPKAADFRYIAYCQKFETVAAGSVTGGATPSTSITPGAATGPTLQTFPAGAVILGITAAGVQAQTTTSAFQYASSFTQGLRNMFALAFQYTNDEVITPNGPVLAEALLGGGEENIFPSREIVIAPSQGILATVQSYTISPPMNVHLVYHSMVLRTAN